jgi:hypothetical protein
VITVPHLDAESARRVERVLQETAHVQVERIASPRQRLEDLFMQIVERARAEKTETSGAQAGGPTAAFLRGEQAAEGGGLIRELLSARPDEAPAPAAPAAAPAPAKAAVVEELVARPAPARTEPARPESSRPEAARPATPPPASRGGGDVDRSVIDDLLGGGGGS